MVNKKLIVICSAFVVDPLVMTSYTPLVQAIKTTFNADITLVALSATFHMLPLSLLCLFSGTLSDLYYRPKILMYGLFISSFGSLLGALSPTISVFLLSRSIQGIGSALIMPIALALIGDITPREEIGRAMGFNSMFNAFFSTSLGPLISGFLGDIDWRLVSLYLFAYCLLIGVLSRIILRGFVVSQEKRSISLLFQKIRHVVGNRNIALLGAVGFISMFAWAGVQPLISDTLALPPFSMKESEIGTMYSIVGFIGILFAYMGGVLTDKLGAKNNMIFGLAMEILPIFLLTFFNSYWSYLVLLTVQGGFMRVMLTSRSTLMVGLMPEARGSVSSIVQFASFLGFSLSPIIMPQIYVSFGINAVYMANVYLLLISLIFVAFIRVDRSK
jgi:ACDE family multidrug resistance protein